MVTNNCKIKWCVFFVYHKKIVLDFVVRLVRKISIIIENQNPLKCDGIKS